MMCKVCGESFEDTAIRRGYDEYPYGEESVWQCTHGACPACGAQDFAEEQVCVQCGESVSEDLTNGFCRYCKEELEQTLEWICGMLTPAQMRWMSEHPDWIERGNMLC